MRLPPPPKCGKTLVVRASPLARDRYARNRGIFFAIVAALIFAIGPQWLIVWWLIAAALGFAALHAFVLVLRARLDHHIVLGRRSIRFRGKDGELRKLQYDDVAIFVEPGKLVIERRGERYVIPSSWLPHEWSPSDLAMRVRARKDRLDDAASEALAVSGSDAALMVKRGRTWKLRETLNASDALGVVASLDVPARLVCRSSALGRLQAALGTGYRSSHKVELSAVEIPW